MQAKCGRRVKNGKGKKVKEEALRLNKVKKST
jgi:hypothetical protein